jgi:4-methyl-5(b-hydroxyethyl)-thiazole monophosphate biosynthesis
MKSAIVVFADGFEEVEAITPVDYLRRAGIQVATVSCGEGLEVPGAHGITVRADKNAREAVDFLPDAVVCPGGMPGAANIASCGEAVSLILKARDSKKITAALCASPIVVFAKLGLLAGKTFTCFPGMEDQARQWAGAEADKLMRGGAKTMRAVEVDGTVITGQGPGAAEEFALALIGELLGADAAQKIQKESWLRPPRE